MKKVLGMFSLLMTCTLLAAILVPAAPATAGDGDGNYCTGDVNGDGVVNVLDLVMVLQQFGCEKDCGDADVNADGVVDVHDLLAVISNFGVCGEAECVTHVDCDDGDPCTINFCLQGTCINAPNPHPDCQEE